MSVALIKERTGAADTIATALREAASRLAAAGIDEPRREARVLLAAALQADSTAILGYPERELAADEAARIADLVGRRVAREPAARLLGRREFWSLDFKLSPETLVPRPDSETLVEAALDVIPDRTAPLRLLDFGTGTGCLLLALLSELPAATGIGVDIAAGAAAAACENAAALGLGDRAAFFVGKWGDAISSGGFDVIIANPPYIRSDAIAGLAPEVAQHEPRRALDGGADGLVEYRLLAPDIRRLLSTAGVALLEVGAGQAGSVAMAAKRAGLEVHDIRRDLAGVERCLLLRKACRTL